MLKCWVAACLLVTNVSFFTYIQLQVRIILKLPTRFSVKLVRMFLVQDGPREHHKLIVDMLISWATAMRHGPRIFLWQAGGILTAFIIVTLKLCLIMKPSGDGIIGFVEILMSPGMSLLHGGLCFARCIKY